MTKPRGTRRRVRPGALALAASALAALATFAPAALAAQSAATLERVDSLIVVGRTEEARAALVEWLAAHGTRARADAQRALWLRAVLTVDPVQAAVDYQRLVVEYPGGPYSDRALLRLAQAADAQGDGARARDLLGALMRDYPSGPARLEAGALLETLAAKPADPSTPPVQSVRDPVPPAREVVLPPEPPAKATRPDPASAKPAPARAARGNAAADAQPTAVEAKPVPTPTPSAPAADSGARGAAVGRPWTVQLGAFASPDRAEALVQELRSAGVEARQVVVPGSRLIRVRAGRFERQPDADRERERLAASGLAATVAGDADREEAAP